MRPNGMVCLRPCANSLPWPTPRSTKAKKQAWTGIIEGELGRALCPQELQDPTFLCNGEPIQLLADVVLDPGKVLDQP